MVEMPVTHAFMGCGNWGPAHLEWFTFSNRFEVAWVIDKREEALLDARAPETRWIWLRRLYVRNSEGSFVCLWDARVQPRDRETGDESWAAL